MITILSVAAFLLTVVGTQWILLERLLAASIQDLQASQPPSVPDPAPVLDTPVTDPRSTPVHLIPPTRFLGGCDDQPATDFYS